jgi:hypothetical protein
MDTPPIGEIDFIRKPDGSQKVDIFDIVKAIAAYGSSGYDIFDRRWLPGTDLAPPGGQIDIFDIVTVTAQYGTEWD